MRAIHDWKLGCLLLLAGCVELPAGTASERVDGGLGSSWMLDGGARRPPTGDPYTGPQCDPGEAAGGVIIAGDGGSRFVGASDARVASGLEPEAPGAGGASGMVAAPVARSAGQLVISELMTNPAALRDDDGEWIELYNPNDRDALALDGCALDDGAAMRALADGLRVPPRGYVALARTAQVGFVPAQLIAFSLGNAADSVALVCAGVQIDRVSYGAGFPLLAGASTALDPGALDAIANDDAGAWCAGKVPDAAGELGTPGEPNPPCEGEDAGL